jgi:hypothetical protein
MTESPHDNGEPLGRIPYGCGMVAGPKTIVAGTRAGVKFGFETSPHRSALTTSSRTAASRRIALGSYGAEELQSMFSQDPFSSFNSTMGSSVSLGHTSSRSRAEDLGKSPDTHANQLEDEGPPRERAAAALTTAEARDIFSKLDTNSDGKISMMEFILGVRTDGDIAHRLALPTENHREDESRDIYQHVFGDIDWDTSKDISLEEFLSYYEQIRSVSANTCDAEADSSYDELTSIINGAGSEVCICLQEPFCFLLLWLTFCASHSDAMVALGVSAMLLTYECPFCSARLTCLQQKNLEPLMLKDEKGIEGFWIDKRNKTAYHVSRIGPVSDDGSERRKTPSNTLKQNPKLGGELPPMDPRRALQPERMDHLEQVANFLYAKVGPLPEVMVRVRLRIFDTKTWASWKQRQREAAWGEAKSLIRIAASNAGKTGHGGGLETEGSDDNGPRSLK